MDFSFEIRTARKCPYCGNDPDYVDSSIIYGISYGMIYLCSDCDAYVGVHHKTSRKALGRLANKELREAKKEAHFYFDQLWRANGKRKQAYKWLSEQLGIPKKFTHIGMFDLDTCKKVIELCNDFRGSL